MGQREHVLRVGHQLLADLSRRRHGADEPLRPDLEALSKAPQQHRDLIVRVAGYSDYFCDLSVALQEEIIARTEHQEP